MQKRFNMKTDTLEFIRNWAFSTWSDATDMWHFEVSGPTKWEQGGPYASRAEAEHYAKMVIYKAN